MTAPAPRGEEPHPLPLPRRPLRLGQSRVAVSPVRETSSRKVAVVAAARAPPLLLFLLVPTPPHTAESPSTPLNPAPAAPLLERSLHHLSARQSWPAPCRSPPTLSLRAGAYPLPGGASRRTHKCNLIPTRAAPTSRGSASATRTIFWASPACWTSLSEPKSSTGRTGAPRPTWTGWRSTQTFSFRLCTAATPASASSCRPVYRKKPAPTRIRARPGPGGNPSHRDGGKTYRGGGWRDKRSRKNVLDKAHPHPHRLTQTLLWPTFWLPAALEPRRTVTPDTKTFPGFFYVDVALILGRAGGLLTTNNEQRALVLCTCSRETL